MQFCHEYTQHIIYTQQNRQRFGKRMAIQWHIFDAFGQRSGMASSTCCSKARTCSGWLRWFKWFGIRTLDSLDSLDSLNMQPVWLLTGSHSITLISLSLRGHDFKMTQEAYKDHDGAMFKWQSTKITFQWATVGSSLITSSLQGFVIFLCFWSNAHQSGFWGVVGLRVVERSFHTISESRPGWSSQPR